jgi:hypothetical protein
MLDLIIYEGVCEALPCWPAYFLAFDSIDAITIAFNSIGLLD